jgi:hypothetical protein
MFAKMSYRRKEEHEKKLRKRRRKNCVKTKRDGQYCVLDNLHKMETPQYEIDIISA